MHLQHVRFSHSSIFPNCNYIVNVRLHCLGLVQSPQGTPKIRWETIVPSRLVSLSMTRSSTHHTSITSGSPVVPVRWFQAFFCLPSPARLSFLLHLDSHSTINYRLCYIRDAYYRINDYRHRCISYEAHGDPLYKSMINTHPQTRVNQNDSQFVVPRLLWSGGARSLGFVCQKWPAPCKWTCHLGKFSLFYTS